MNLQAPDKSLLIEVKRQKRIKPSRRQQDLPVLSPDFVTVFQKWVAPRPLDAKVPVITEKLIGSGDVNGITIECNTAEPPVRASTRKVDLAGIPVDALLHHLGLKIDSVNTSMALPLLTTADN